MSFISKETLDFNPRINDIVDGLTTQVDGMNEIMQEFQDNDNYLDKNKISTGYIHKGDLLGVTTIDSVEYMYRAEDGRGYKLKSSIVIPYTHDGSGVPNMNDFEEVSYKKQQEQIQICSTNIENIEEQNNNVWIADDTGKRSLMVKIPRFKISDVLDGILAEDDGWHSAFVVNGVVKDCIYISKYQNIVENGRAYSLGGKTPRAYINFDQAKLACEAKGTGWHLMSNAEWAAIALWCKKNETEPLGNNYAGSHYVKKHLCGTEGYTWKYSSNWNGRAYKEEPAGTYWHTGTTETGSTPKEFAHNSETDGIYDLNGNVWEWVGGMRLQNGEIQVIPDNNAAITGMDMSSTSTEWKGMLQDGSYATPGTSDTLKYDNTSGLPKLNVTTDATAYENVAFKDLLEESGIVIPAILKALTLAPSGNAGGDKAYINTGGERKLLRGGRWNSTSSTGVFALHLNSVRTTSSSTLGFRSAFVI